jgi:hypothetical protein
MPRRVSTAPPWVGALHREHAIGAFESSPQRCGVVHVAGDDLDAARGKAAGGVGIGIAGNGANAPTAVIGQGAGHGPALLAGRAEHHDDLG